VILSPATAGSAKAPKIVGNDLVKRMKPGWVLVDIAIDQGDCCEDSRPTHAGRLTSAPVAQAHGYTAVSLADILS
jgi:alanine dehydrogenase